MLINKDGDKNQILELLIEMLNNSNNKDIETRKKLAILYLRFCLYDQNIDSINFEFTTDLPKKTLGTFNARRNIIYMNENAFDKRTNINMLTTIAHEVRHFKQILETKPFKTFDIAKAVEYPIENYDSNLKMMVTKADKLNTYSYYLSSNEEQDARNYSMNATRYLLDLIKAEADKSSNAYKLAKKEYKVLDKMRENEHKAFVKAKEYVKYNEHELKLFVYKHIEQLINLTFYDEKNKKDEHLNKYINKDINTLLNLYCDNYLTNKIIKFGYQIKSADTLLTLINNKHTIIDKKLFTEIVDYVYKNTDLEKNDILKKLDNWKEESLNEVFSKPNTFSKKLNTKKTIKQPNNFVDIKINQDFNLDGNDYDLMTYKESDGIEK